MNISRTFTVNEIEPRAGFFVQVTSNMQEIQSITERGRIKSNEHVESISIGNYVIQCSVCKGKVSLEAGDVIFGNEWYHSDCWELVEERVP